MTAKPRLVFATTCADRKAAIARERVHLRDVPKFSAEPRVRRWAKRLGEAGGGRAFGDHLYQGDHWVASENALAEAAEAGFDAKLWVISAGYGLYPSDTAVASYAATFATGHEDSVVPPGCVGMDRISYLREWWQAIAREIELPGAMPRTFAELADSDPGVAILVVAGGTYLDAIAEDLRMAAEILRSSDRLVVVSCGASAYAKSLLEEWVLPVDSRFQSIAGGTRSALNARVARWLMKELVGPADFAASKLRMKVDAVASGLAAAPIYDREQMTDGGLQEWIVANVNRFERPSASAMLRLLRDEGRACEQKRFGRLFKGVISKMTEGATLWS